jgi:hypothetical protein
MMGSDARYRLRVGVLVGVLVVLCSTAAVVGAGGASETDGDNRGSTAGVGNPDLGFLGAVDADETTFRVAVDDDGTGYWTVEFRFLLDGAASEAAFDRAKENLSDPPTEFLQAFRTSVVREAENRTGRSMRLLNGSIEHSRDAVADEGFVRIRFEWAKFAAAASDTRLVVGDAIDGFYLRENWALRVEWNEGIDRVSVTPEPSEVRAGVARWDGELRFRSGAPRLELSRDPPTGGPPVTLLAGAAVGAVALVAVGWYGRSRLRDGHDGLDGAGLEDDLLTDEERVIRLIEARGGRTKQQDLIETFDWSRTKVSDVVNEMNEAERVEVYRLGRENVVALPGEVKL